MDTQTTPDSRPKHAYALTVHQLTRHFTLGGILPTLVCCARATLAAENLLPALLALAAGGAGYVLAHFFRKEKDAGDRLLNGLVVWMAGLIAGLWGGQKAVKLFLSPLLCMAGAGFCLRQIIRLKTQIKSAEAFAKLRSSPIPFYLLSLPLCLIESTGIALLAVLGLVCAAFVCAFLFPLTARHFRMLEKWQKEPENKALNEQLERVVFHRSCKPYLLRFLVMILRPLFHHRLIGVENVHLDAEIPCIFVCNHGEIYGPVAAVLYVPFAFRPWVAYEITDKATMADRTLNGALANVKCLPPKMLRWIVEKLAAPLCASVMRQVNAIPVYHDHPRKLMQTFRETAYAMEAGDNILIFPENPVKEDAGKYLREGVSEFFTGFTLIGQMYHSRTGLCPQFIPMYANKRKRTISFGPAVRYDPTHPANEEKERLCDTLRAEMLRMANAEDAAQPGATIAQ